jgi:hypothetical protein
VTEFSNPFNSPDEQLRAYVESLRAALGERDPMTVLSATPAALAQAVNGLSPQQQGAPEKPGKWSVRHVVQHLADAELVGAFRYRMVLAHDAPELPAYDQDRWADRLRYQDADLPTALDDFAALRRANLRLLRAATPADLQRLMRHSERGEESLEKLVWMFAGHDLVHLRQIARIRQAIGALESTPASV